MSLPYKALQRGPLTEPCYNLVYRRTHVPTGPPQDLQGSWFLLEGEREKRTGRPGPKGREGGRECWPEGGKDGGGERREGKVVGKGRNEGRKVARQLRREEGMRKELEKEKEKEGKRKRIKEGR